MENFVSIILKQHDINEDAIVDAMLDSLDAPLAEQLTDYGIFESENDTIVLRMPTPYALDEDECETFTQAFAEKMFEMGYDDFDVEISLDEGIKDIVNKGKDIINKGADAVKKGLSKLGGKDATDSPAPAKAPKVAAPDSPAPAKAPKVAAPDADENYDGDDLGNAPTTKTIVVNKNNYKDMIARAKELKAKMGKSAKTPGSATDDGGLGQRPAPKPKANSAVNTTGRQDGPKLAESIISAMLGEEITDAEKKEYNDIIAGLEKLLASPDIDPPVKAEIDTALNDFKPDRGDPRKAGQPAKGPDDGAGADEPTDQDKANDAKGKGQTKEIKPKGPVLSKESALQKFAKSNKGGLANHPDEVDAIKELQESLKAMGYEIEVNGKYDPGTTDVVKQFQTMMGVTVNGDAGPETIAAITRSKSIPGILTFYKDLIRMNELIAKANEGIVFETMLYEALNDAEKKEFEDLYTKHKAKFDDAEYTAAMPQSIRDKMPAISKYKAGAGATSSEEKADAEEQVKAQEVQKAVEDEVAKIIADAKEKYAGDNPTRLNKYLIMVAAKYIRKKEYALAIEIIEKANLNVGEDVYLALLRKSALKGIDAPSTSDSGADEPTDQDKANDAMGRDTDGEEGGETGGEEDGEASAETFPEMEEKVERIRKGIKSTFGTAEGMIKSVLESLQSKDEWDALQQAYLDEYNDELLADLRNEFDDWFTSEEKKEANFNETVAAPLKKIGVEVSYKASGDEPAQQTTSDQEADASASYTGDYDKDQMTYFSSSMSKEETQEFVDSIKYKGKEVTELADLESKLGKLISTLNGNSRNPVTQEILSGKGEAVQVIKEFRELVQEEMRNPTEEDPDDTSSADNQDAADDAMGRDGEEGEVDKGEVTLGASELKDIAKEVYGAFGYVTDDEELVGEQLGKLETIADFEELQKTFKEEHDEDLVEYLQDQFNRSEFKEYATDVLAKIGVEVSYKGAYGEVNEARIGNFTETYDGNEFFEVYGWIGLPDDELWEAEYQGRKVTLNKPMRGDVKKFKVYVKNTNGNIIKVNFGDPDMRIKRSDPGARASFRARHNCDNPGPRTKARYWSCKNW